MRRAMRWLVPPAVFGLVLAGVQPAQAAKPPPDTTITSGPAALTRATTATFAFSSNTQNSTFTCRLDAAAATACTSPVTYSGLAAGQHTFSVAASAGGLTDASPAVANWTVDLTPPTAPANLAATTPSATSVALTWQAGTDNIGVTGNQIVRDGVLLATVGAVTGYTDSTVVAASTHTYVVRAVDGAGNVSASSNSVTATTPNPPPAPDTLIDSAPAALSNSTSASFAFHSTITGSTFTCTLDAGTPASCTSPKTYTALAQGGHTFSVAATASGVSDASPAQATWTVDSLGPSVPAGLAATTPSATSVALTWAASTDPSGVAGYDVYRNGALLASQGTVTSYADTGLTSGTLYTYAVRARDTLGNVSALSPAVAVKPMSAYDAHLTRAPYLTDLVGLHVAINYATDQSATTGSIRYGAVDSSGNCSPATTLASNRITIQVGAVAEYQWTAQLNLPASGTYCYRVYLGATDLLAGNATPRFTTQVPFGSTSSFSFDVLGDWGQVDANGANADQANLLSQIAASGARFAVTVGDNGYSAGSQINYGDLQQTGADTSAIFGPNFWTVPGASIPIFTAAGNHGLAGVTHTDITTWTQASAVANSGGRYQNDVYCCVNGSTSANYGSEWYAFNAGNARFYILDSAWGDTNGGTASPYANDALAHFAPGAPEYTWLLNDLQANPTQLKFAFSHYPFYSDNNTQPSDTFLQGAANLEGLLGSHGVQLVFNGHAHIYERNTASASGMPITYVTGGGGATLEPMGACNNYDAYGIGWSPTNLAGSACGGATPPASAANVFHFLKVTVSGTSVTVTPTDSLGNTFDVRTYKFNVPPDTYIDSAPPAGTTSSTATFTFHASGSPASYTCTLDGGTAAACTSPRTYTGLAQRSHTFTVTATVGKVVDPTPARATWTVDSTAPSAPTGLTATTPNPFEVDLAWTAATDNTGVTGYRIYRDGSAYRTIGAVTSFSDAVLGSSTHQYAVSALDIAGNESPRTSPVTATTSAPPAPVFADGFESGGLASWTTTAGLTVETATVNSGSYAAEANTTNGGTYAKETLPATYPDAYARVLVDVISSPSQINLLRLRDAADASLAYLYVDNAGHLGVHDDALGTNTPSSQTLTPGWHALELHLRADSSAGTATGALEVWVDNTFVADLSSNAVDVGAAPVGKLQIGETQLARTYDVVFDDVAFGTDRLGPVADATPPSTPTGLTGSAASAFEADLSWNASTDDVGVAGYDVFRDGALLAQVGAVTSYADGTVLGATSHQYAVRARDGSGNVSPLTAAVTVTTPAAALPVFADGFESGDLSAWTSSAGLAVQSTDVRSGGFAADGNTTAGGTYAKRTLPGTYADAYARVAFLVNSQGAQTTLLRLRDTPTGNGGYLYLTSTGRLAFRSDALTAGTLSATAPGPGWHALELHLNVNGASSSVETWLDGTAVADLTFASIDLGTNPMGVLQIGDTTTTGSWDVVFDDAAFGTSRLGPVGDTTPPSAPTALTGSAPSPFEADLSWGASTDDVGVTGYDVFRDGALLAQAGTGTSYADTTVLASTSHDYAVRARDAAGNVSPLSTPVTVVTPAAAAPLFADGFESGDLSAWTASAGLVAQGTDVRSGSFAADGNTTAGATYAKKTLPATYADAYARVGFLVKSQGAQVTLLRLRDTPTGVGGYVYLTATGKLAFRSDALAAGTVSAVGPGPGWHVLELHLQVNGVSSVAEVWLDGAAVTDLTFPAIDLGTAPIGVLQLGDTTGTGSWDVVFDDAAFGTSRLGTGGDTTAPSTPTGLAATAPTPFEVDLSWSASTDDTGVTGYDVFRDGSLLAQVGGALTAYADTAVLAASTHSYAVRARDGAGNVSPQTSAVTVTTPAAPVPVFADGFESGDGSAWTATAGLVTEGSDVRSGSFAAEGSTVAGATWAKRTLPGTYADAYARVAFLVKSQGAQMTLLRLRDTPTGNGGYLYLTATGRLAFRSDALAAGTVSSTAPTAGWHALELHLSVNGVNSSVQTWLDGAAVSSLTFPSIDLGTNPMGVLQIGDTTTTGSWDVVFDDAAFGTSRLGPVGDTTPPSTPTGFTAVAASAFEADLSWGASTDDVGVAGYDVFRDGAPLVSLDAAATGYADTTVLASTSHDYAVRARDASGNLSPLTAPVTVVTPAAAAPVFADGFESGNLSAWTTSGGLVVQGTDVRSGSFAAEGNTAVGATYAKKTLPATYDDGYARVAFLVKSQTSQLNLLRLRAADGTSIGFLYLDTSHRLGFRNDVAATSTVSAVVPSAGWHVAELHLTISTGRVDVWLDGAAVTALAASGANLGTGSLGGVQIGETTTARTYDVVFDDAAFGTTRLGVA